MKALRIGVLFSLVALVSAALHGESGTGPSPAMFRGNPQHTGVYAEGTATVSKPWHLQTGHMVQSSPAVENGVVYIGSSDKNLYALDATSGLLLWKSEAGGAVRSSPALFNGAVYFQAGDNQLYAVDLETHKLRWQFATGADLPFHGGWDYFLSSPLIDSGVVYFGSGDGYVYAVNAEGAS
jgi:eukaryotic-like serine/threonine-protein kinase